MPTHRPHAGPGSDDLRRRGAQAPGSRCARAGKVATDACWPLARSRGDRVGRRHPRQRALAARVHASQGGRRAGRVGGRGQSPLRRVRALPSASRCAPVFCSPSAPPIFRPRSSAPRSAATARCRASSATTGSPRIRASRRSGSSPSRASASPKPDQYRATMRAIGALTKGSWNAKLLVRRPGRRRHGRDLRWRRRPALPPPRGRSPRSQLDAAQGGDDDARARLAGSEAAKLAPSSCTLMRMGDAASSPPAGNSRRR